MAVDTAAKRASVQSYTLGLMRPPPDGTVGTQDRPTLAWFYAGMVYAAAVLVVSRVLAPFICNVGTMMRR